MGWRDRSGGSESGIHAKCHRSWGEAGGGGGMVIWEAGEKEVRVAFWRWWVGWNVSYEGRKGPSDEGPASLFLPTHFCCDLFHIPPHGRASFPSSGATFGEAGTIFLDQTLFEQLEKAKVSASSLDRYSTIVMGGIAAEALTFQNAQGGSSDEQALILLMSLLGFPLDRISNQARWAALRAVLVIKDYPEAYEALVAALQAGKSVGQCVLAIEDALEATDRPLVPLPAVGPPPSPPPAPVPSSGAKEYADLQRVLMPSLPPSLANADLSNLTPSFTKGTDVIPAVEAREKKQLAALEEQLKARQRAVNFRLKQVTAQLEGKSPEEVSGMGGEEETQGKIELRGEEMDEEKEIEDQLKSLDERLKALNMQLGGRVGGKDLGGRRGAR